MTSDRSASQQQSIAELLFAVPEPSEDEVMAAVYAYRAGLEGLQPDFDQLAPWMRKGLVDDMRRALHAAAMARAVAGTKDVSIGPLPDLPRHWHVTRAIVSAAEATREDPEAIRHGARSRGRFYAGAGLHKVFPATTINGCLALCGGGPQANIRLRSAMRTDWWRQDVIDLVALAVRAEPEPAKSSLTLSLPRPAAGLASTLVSADWLRTSAPDPGQPKPTEAQPACAVEVDSPRPMRQLSPLAKIIDRRPSGPMTHALMGDPLPGRSALDQRRAQQATSA